MAKRATTNAVDAAAAYPSGSRKRTTSFTLSDQRLLSMSRDQKVATFFPPFFGEHLRTDECKRITGWAKMLDGGTARASLSCRAELWHVGTYAYLEGEGKEGHTYCRIPNLHHLRILARRIHFRPPSPPANSSPIGCVTSGKKGRPLPAFANPTTARDLLCPRRDFRLIVLANLPFLDSPRPSLALIA